MTLLGLSKRGSEIIGVEEQGQAKLVRVLARGANERSARRTARLRAADIIPFKEQELVSQTLDRSFGRFNKRYIITFTG